MKNQMFIRVTIIKTVIDNITGEETKVETKVDRDIRYTTVKERMDYYNTLYKGQITMLFEKFVVDNIEEAI